MFFMLYLGLFPIFRASFLYKRLSLHDILCTLLQQLFHVSLVFRLLFIVFPSNRVLFLDRAGVP